MEYENIDENKLAYIILIQKGINYIISSMKDIKINYMKVDMPNNIIQINQSYALFQK